MQRGFIAYIAPEAADLSLVRQSRHAPLRTALSSSLGFGGTNASLVLRPWEG